MRNFFLKLRQIWHRLNDDVISSEKKLEVVGGDYCNKLSDIRLVIKLRDQGLFIKLMLKQIKEDENLHDSFSDEDKKVINYLSNIPKNRLCDLTFNKMSTDSCACKIVSQKRERQTNEIIFSFEEIARGIKINRTLPAEAIKNDLELLQKFSIEDICKIIISSELDVPDISAENYFSDSNKSS